MGSNPELAAVATADTDAKSADALRTSLDRSLGYHIHQLGESMTAAFHQRVDAHGVNQGQWRYLRELWEEDGLTQKDLSDRVGRQGATTVTAVRSLEAAGFVRIEQNEVDRRRNRVQLTALGRRTWEKLAPLIGEVQRAALSGLSAEEVQNFSELLVRIQHNVDRLHRGRNHWSLLRTEKFAERLGERRRITAQHAAAAKSKTKKEA